LPWVKFDQRSAFFGPKNARIDPHVLRDFKYPFRIDSHLGAVFRVSLQDSFVHGHGHKGKFDLRSSQPHADAVRFLFHLPLSYVKGTVAPNCCCSELGSIVVNRR
jgi:hypothetical protein